MADGVVNSTPVFVIVKNLEGEMDALLLGRTKELAAYSSSERNWSGIFIALLVIAAVLGLITFSIYLMSPEDEGARVKERRLTLPDIIGNSLRWKPFNGTWINDGELVYRDPSGGLVMLVVETFTVKILMTNSTFRQLNTEKFLVSPNLKYVLLLSDCSLHGSRCFVYEIQNRNIFPLSPNDDNRETPLLQHVLWAPNNIIKSSSQAIAFVYENDLYYKPDVEKDLVCRITTTGEDGVIYNGVPDWFYDHTSELKSDTIAFSSDGSYLSYLLFNDSLVSKYEYTWFGDNLKYPKIKSVRYPKEGLNNPNVTVYVVDLSVLKFIRKVQIKPHSNPYCKNSYVGNMKWISSTDFTVTFTNREQTSALTIVCRAPTFNCKEIHIENVINNGSIFPADKAIFSKRDTYFRNSGNLTRITLLDSDNSNNESTFIKNEFEMGGFMLKRLPVRDGEHGYYQHVVIISMSNMKSVPLTMGRFEVTEILGWDESNDIVYFMATPILKPGQRHLYKIKLMMTVTEKPNRIFISSTVSVCMTCDNSARTFKLMSNSSNGNISAENWNFNIAEIPNNCLFNQIYFSKDYTYYVQECLGPETPSVYLVETSTLSKMMVLHSGDLLRTHLSQLATPQIRTVSIELRNGFYAQVRLFLPPGMKEDEEVAFPLIVHMDASPGGQLVSEKYHIDYNWYLCSQKSIIVAQIDGSGSGFQGELLRSQVKNKLGTVEIEDQLNVLTYLRDNLKFVDPNRICAYGWGYGGYAAAMTLAEDSQRVLKCALAINPIVSFAYHNSFFTERYMPRNNDYLRALQESDLSMRAGSIDSKNFFLIHGTADITVHEQHSLILSKALIKMGVEFRHQIYTDQDHNLSGVLYHLFKTIEWFFDENFGPTDGEWGPTGFFSFDQY